jgi:hypothetical protein
MNEKNIKSIAFGMILTLIFFSFTSTIEAISIIKDDENKIEFMDSIEENETIEIVIKEHFIDGINTEIIKQIKVSDFKSFKEKLSNVLSLEEKLKILQEYHIIKEEITLDRYKKNFQEIHDKDQLKKRYYDKINTINIGRNIIWQQNFMCAVYLLAEGINIPIGFSLLTAYINEERFNNYHLLIPSIDLTDLCFGYAFFRTKGPLGRITFGGDKTFSGLVGFAGISIREKESVFTGRTSIYLGFSIYAYSLIFNI